MLRFALKLTLAALVACSSLHGQVYGDRDATKPWDPNPFPEIVSPPPQPIVNPRAIPASGNLLAISTRGYVADGERVLIAGLAISEGDSCVLVRAIGPSLAPLGVKDCLKNPQLEIMDANGKSIARAVPYRLLSSIVKREISTAARDVGAFPVADESNDSILLIYLKQGLYTCIVSSTDGSPGVALIEAYRVPTGGWLFPP